VASRVRLDWNGDAILAEVAEAARAAIDETTQAVDDDATTSHWWRNRSGYLQRKIVTEDAVINGHRVRGSVGATYSGTKGVRSAFYGLFLEYKLPWLRPAADRNFHTLADRIRRRLER
jgi:hypothetical protein